MRTVNVEKWGDQYRLVYIQKGFGANALDLGLRKRKRDDSQTGGNGDSSEQADSGGRLENNIARARTRVRELAACNRWDYFLTGTFDARKVDDRFDLRHLRKRLGEFWANYKRRSSSECAYVIIPEQHKNGAWHVHGILRGLSDQSLYVNQFGYLGFKDWERRFGFCSLSPIISPRRVASYITKYVTKDFGTDHEAREHMFYASTGLKGRERLGTFPVSDAAVADYEGEWCGLSWVGTDKKIGQMITQWATETDSAKKWTAAAQLLSELEARTDNWTEDKMLQALTVSKQAIIAANAPHSGAQQLG